MKKRLAMLALAGVMTMTTLTGCGGKLDNDATVATVDGEEISVGLANFYARMMQAQYETYYAGYLGEDMWSGEASEGKTYEAAVKDQVMEELQNMVISKNHMEEYNVELTDEEKKSIDKAAEAFEDANASSDKEKVSGDKAIVKEFLKLATIRQKVEKAVKDGTEVEVSDEEAAQKAMQYVMFSNYTVDETGATVELSEEEIAQKKADAQKFAEEAADAEDFELLVESYGEEVQTATFDAEEETSIPADLAKEADKLKEGEVTGAVETENGVYIAKVTSLFDKDATEAEKQSRIDEKKQEAYDKQLKSWRKDAKIDVKKSVWKKVDFKDLKVTMKVEETDPYTENPVTDDQAEEDAPQSENTAGETEE